ncbi:MAG: argininosuccinate lyase [Pseudomonadota bacterium]
MTTESFTSSLGKSKAFPATPLYEGDKNKDLAAALNRHLQLHKAHLVMLTEQGIISRDDARIILQELFDMETKGLDSLEIDPSLGLYLSTEKHLVDKLGTDVAGKMHTARSRNDLDPANYKMYVRDCIEKIIQAIIDLQSALIEKSQEHADTVMPGYTHHSQQAQPITYGHFLMATHDALNRDITRLEQAYSVANLCPLGGCALAGTGFPIDRDRVAELLGFEGLVENTLDATGHYDFILQVTSAIAITLSNLGRMTEGLYLWNTAEFGMLEMDAAYCSVSSIMPQKKNPVAMEMVRGESVLVYNRLNAMLCILKALPLGGGREWQYVHKSLPECVNTAVNAMKTLAGMISTMKVKKDVMVLRAAQGFGTVTELADEMVRSCGLPFRHAHHIVGTICLNALSEGKTSDEITLAMVNDAAEMVIGRSLNLDEQTLKKALDPVLNVAVRDTIGGPAPKEVLRMIKDRKRQLNKNKEQLEERKKRLKDASDKLLGICRTYI